MWNLSLQEHMWAPGKALTQSCCCCCCLRSCRYSPAESGWQETSWGDGCGFVEFLLARSTWGPQALARRKAQAGTQSLAKARCAGLCLWPGQMIALAVNLGGLFKSEWGNHKSLTSVYYTREEKQIPAHKWFKSMTGASRGEPILLLYSQEIM